MITDLKNYFIHNSWQEVFFRISTYFFVGTLPLFLNLNTIALWAFAISSILVFNKHNGYHNLRKNLYIIGPTLILFLLFVLGLWLSNDTGRVLKDLGRVVPLVIIPLFISVHRKQDFNLKRIYIALGIGLFVGMIICWFTIIESILSKPDPLKQASYFFQWIYTDFNLIKPLGNHPSYFAVLLVIFMSAILFNKEFSNLRRSKLKLVLLLFPFFLFLIETNSRIGLISLVFIILFHTLHGFNLKRSLYVLAFFIITILFSIQFDYLGNKFKKLIDSKGDISIVRVDRWKKIIEIFRDEEKLWLGVGSGDSRLFYREAYIKGDFKLALENNYNAHSQYIEFLVSNGVIGLALYILVLFYFIKYTYKSPRAIHFIIVFILFSFSESFLGRSQGVMIFSFFYSFLLLQNKTSKNFNYA